MLQVDFQGKFFKNSLFFYKKNAQKLILGLPNEKKNVKCPRPFPTRGKRALQKNQKLVKIIMKTIAILALTAAALVSCQQQQQIDPVDNTPITVETSKK